MLTNAINWFEIPVTDFDRAKAFYSEIFDFVMPVMPNGTHMMGFLLHEQGKGIGGAIVKGEGYQPAKDGVLIYLNGGSDLNIVLNRVAAAGGQVHMAKTLISPELGYFAIFYDTEGNRLALHSMK